MKVIKKTSIDRVIQVVQMDLGTEITPFEIIEWTGRALEQCQAIPDMRQYTAFCEVQNHRVSLPPNLIYIQQIARNNCFEASPTCPITLTQQEEEVTADNLVMEPAVIDCNGQLIGADAYAYYRPFFTMTVPYVYLSGAGMFKECYTPVRLSNHTFFNSLVCKESSTDLYCPDCRDEYGIDGEDLLLSFASGQVAISYFGPDIDDQGRIQIPDHETYIQAIVSYIRLRLAVRKMTENPSNATIALKNDAERDWQWYCRQAINNGMFHGGLDGFKDIQDIDNWILPPSNRYNSFFGNLTYPQDRVRVLGGETTIRNG